MLHSQIRLQSSYLNFDWMLTLFALLVFLWFLDVRLGDVQSLRMMDWNSSDWALRSTIMNNTHQSKTKTINMIWILLYFVNKMKEKSMRRKCYQNVYSFLASSTFRIFLMSVLIILFYFTSFPAYINKQGHHVVIERTGSKISLLVNGFPFRIEKRNKHLVYWHCRKRRTYQYVQMQHFQTRLWLLQISIWIDF